MKSSLDASSSSIRGGYCSGFFLTLFNRQAGFFYVGQYLWFLVGLFGRDGSHRGWQCSAPVCLLIAPRTLLRLVTAAHTSAVHTPARHYSSKNLLNHQTVLYYSTPGAAHTSIVRRAGSPNLEFTDLKGELKASYKSGSNSIVWRTRLPSSAISI